MKQNFLITETEQADAAHLQFLRPPRIVFFLRRNIVNISINFNRNTNGITVKIYNKMTNGPLPPKVEPIETTIAECLP